MPTNNKDITKWSNRDLYTRIVDTFGMPHVKRRYKQEEEASKYTIPYIPEKEVMLTTGRYNTGKISTNLLDSIYDSSKRTGVPLDIALGLAGRESTLGIGRGFKEGQDVTATDLYSNWQQIQQPAPKSQVDKWNNTINKEKRGEALTENDYADRNDFLIGEQQRLEQHKPITEHPIDNALKFYQTGKYNPGNKNHSKMVEEDGKALMSDPAIQKWLKTKTGTQMKCGGRKKAQLGLDIREGGVAIPIANNMFYIDGRKHAAGGVAIGPNNKNGVEVEGGEVVEMIDSKHPSVGRQFKAGGQQQTMRVFSSVPFLRGASPAELVMGGANPNKVFAAQEEFKDRHRINDDGTRYEVGGEKRIYTPSKSIQRQIQETGKITIGGAPTIGGLRTAKYVKGLATAKGYAKQANKIFTKVDNFVNNSLQGLINKHKITPNQADAYKKFYNEIVGVNGINIPKTASFFLNNDNREMKFGGNMIYEINGNVRNGLSLRPKAKYGTIDKKDKDVKVGQDGLIYKRAADGEWYTDGTVHVAFKKATPNGLIKPNLSSAKKFNYTAPEPKRVYIDHSDYEEEKETKKIGSLTYEKNKDDNWVPLSKQSTTTTRNGGRPKDFGMTRTGVNHPSGNYKYHPLTGEKVSEMGVVETSKPSVRGTTKVSSKSSSTARGRGIKTSTPKAASQSTPTIQDTVNKITTDAWKASKTPKIKIDESKMPSYNVSDLGSKETKAAKAKLNTSSTGGGTQSKNTHWIGQYKTFRPEDWAGLGTNLAGHIAGYFANNSLLKKYPMPVKPVLFQAAKLKTTHNINPKLATSRETEQMNLAEVGRNTSSSSTSLARKQRIMNEARDARNKLYGEKENIETQLINLDRRNRQDVYNRNISAYNDWLDKTYIAKTNKLSEKQKNMMSLINGIPSAVNHTLGVIETRRNANNAYRAIAAANPNVDARQIGGFDYYEGIGPDGTHKALYDKHQRFVRYI